MNRHVRALLIVGGIALLAAVAGLWALNRPSSETDAGQVLKSPIQLNTVMPDFETKALDGKPLRLSNFQGKIVVVNFWASWCGPCVEEMPSLINLVKSFPNEVALIAISGDSTRGDIDSFLKSFPELKTLPNIHLVWDEDKSLSQKYQILRLPESVLLDPQQKVIKRIAGTINWSAPDALAYIKQLWADSQKQSGSAAPGSSSSAAPVPSSSAASVPSSEAPAPSK